MYLYNTVIYYLYTVIMYIIHSGLGLYSDNVYYAVIIFLIQLYLKSRRARALVDRMRAAALMIKDEIIF